MFNDAPTKEIGEVLVVSDMIAATALVEEENLGRAADLSHGEGLGGLKTRVWNMQTRA